MRTDCAPRDPQQSTLLAVTFAAFSCLVIPQEAHGQVYRWDNGQLIPGTALNRPDFGANFASTDLSVAELTSANLISSTLTSTNLTSARLTFASLGAATLTSANLTSANLTSASFFSFLRGAANLTSANFTDATITRANLDSTTYAGLVPDQFYSTANYRARDLSGISLRGNNLNGWNFASQNLTAADLSGYYDLTPSTLVSADFTNANLNSASLLSSTLTSANFANANLSWASFFESNLKDANFTGTTVTRSVFASTTARGFTASQLYSTASYNAHDLPGIHLESNDLTAWNLASQNLTFARFDDSILTSVNFAQSKLPSATFTSANLTSANFTAAQLSSANFTSATLAFAQLTSANLSAANLTSSTLTSADFTAAVVTRTMLGTTTPRGFKAEQLYSTASYQARDLTGINLSFNNLTAWLFNSQNLNSASFDGSNLTSANFTGASLVLASFRNSNLTGANFSSANLTRADFGSLPRAAVAILASADFTLADLRNVTRLVPVSSTITRNTILADGTLPNGTLALLAGDTLTVRDNPLPVTVSTAFDINPAATLAFLFYDNDFTSPIKASVRPNFAGTLALNVDPATDPVTLLNVPLGLFKYQSAGAETMYPLSAFSQLTSNLDPTLYRWDTSDLYVGGTVVLRPIPEPRTFASLFALSPSLALRRRRRRA